MAEANEVVSGSGSTVRPLTQEELEALTADLQAVLVKHDAEMGVTSTINLMKVVSSPNEPATPTTEEPAGEEVPTEDTNTETESGS
jgi:hypothetical protein